MEVKQISESTIKITIKLEDLEEHGMEMADFLVPQEKTEEFFYTILDELEMPESFLDSGMLSFRVTPKPDKLDVFVTKSKVDKNLNFEDLADLPDMDELSQMTPDEFLKTLEKNIFEKSREDIDAVQMLEKAEEEDASEPEEGQEQDRYIYYILRFSDLKNLIAFTKTIHYPVDTSELYKMDQHYYLTILVDIEGRPSRYPAWLLAAMREHDESPSSRAWSLVDCNRCCATSSKGKLLMVTFPLKFIMVLLGTFFIGILLTPLVRILAFKIDAVDYPNARRINKKPMPSAGGLAVVIAFSITSLIMMPTIVQVTFRGETYFDYIWPVVLGGGVVALTGLIDDVKELSPLPKLLGIVVAASLIWLLTDFRLNDFKIPFGGPHLFFPPWLSFILTLIWIVSITNAVNLMDGLDGLVSGVSIISLLTMGVVSYFFLPDHNLFLTLTIFVLVASIAGFFPYNYHPAIIYGGDTGALFIGFMISVLSLQGLKNATAVAVVTPMIILGVPIADTFLAIVRRTLSGQKFYQPDRNHLHHRLLSLGLTHRGTVLVIYGISLIFATISLLLNISSRVGGVLLVIGLLFGVELLAELIEILGPNRTPLLKIMRYIGNSSYREEVRRRWKNKEHK